MIKREVLRAMKNFPGFSLSDALSLERERLRAIREKQRQERDRIAGTTKMAALGGGDKWEAAPHMTVVLSTDALDHHVQKGAAKTKLYRSHREWVIAVAYRAAADKAKEEG